MPLTAYTAEYTAWGEGPPLVLVPGLAGGTNLLSLLGTSLGKHFRVYSPNLRGESDCFVLRRRFGVVDLLHDLREFIEYLNLERPLLMGVSFGGMLALEFACRWPHRLGGLVVQGADVRFEPSVLRRVAGQVLRGYPLPTNNPFVNQFFNLLFGRRPRNRRLFDFVTRHCWATDQSVMAHRFQLAESIDLGDRLQRVAVPVQLILGGRDLIVSRTGLNEMIAAIPESELIELPDAGHLAFVTHADEMAGTVAKFAQDLGLLETAEALA